MTGGAEVIGLEGPTVLPAGCRFGFPTYFVSDARLSSKEQSSSGCTIFVPVPCDINENVLDLFSADEAVLEVAEVSPLIGAL